MAAKFGPDQVVLPAGSSDPTGTRSAGEIFYNTSDGSVKFNNGTSWADINNYEPPETHRYWRYETLSGSSHHPRCSRIYVIKTNGSYVNIHHYGGSDNCSDSGGIPWAVTNLYLDAGSNISVNGVGFYTVYSGSRLAHINLYYSDDNSSWILWKNFLNWETDSGCGEYNKLW